MTEEAVSCGGVVLAVSLDIANAFNSLLFGCIREALQGANFQEAARLASRGVSLVVGRLEALGLRVALDKTEALLFHGPGRGPPPGASIEVNSVLVPVRAQMRYLGLILDGRWLFDERFRQLAPKLLDAASALG